MRERFIRGSNLPKRRCSRAHILPTIQLPSITSQEKAAFSAWLCRTSQDGDSTAKYSHCRLDEQSSERVNVADLLKKYVRSAHADAIAHHGISRDSLDPFGDAPRHVPGYPYELQELTLQGYLGEVLAGLYAECFDPFGVGGWEVPAFLFRSHDVVFTALERMRQTGFRPGRLPGHPGDDCVAFRRDAAGAIEAIIVCESKCASSHNSALISEAHEQISDLAVQSVSLAAIMHILRDRDSDEARKWISAISAFRDEQPSAAKRNDLVMYVCGLRPKRRAAWMTRTKPHTKYTGRRKLTSVELHVDNVPSLVTLVYRSRQDWDGDTN